MKTFVILLLSVSSVFGQFNFTDLAFTKQESGSGCTTYTIGNVPATTVSLVPSASGGYQEFFASAVYTFTVYAKRLVGSTTMYSSTGTSGSATETDTGITFYISLSWTSVTDATGYRVVVNSDSFGSLPAYFDTTSAFAFIGYNGDAATVVNGIGGYTSGTAVLTPSSPICQ